MPQPKPPRLPTGRKYLSPKDFESATALFVAFYGEEPLPFLVKFQRADLITDLNENKRRMPKRYNAYVNGQYKEDQTNDPATLIEGKMRLGSRAVFQDAEEPGLAIDLEEELRRIMSMLRNAGPLGSTGHYLASYRYVVAGDPRTSVPRNGTFSVAGIANIAPYAATLHNPSYDRPMRSVFKSYVLGRAKKMGYQANFRYLQGSSEPQLKQGKVRDPLRDVFQRGKKKGQDNTFAGQPRIIRYATPFIEIGLPGSLTQTRMGPWRPKNCRRKAGKGRPSRCILIRKRR